MAKTFLGPNAVNTNSDLPTVGTQAPDFALVTTDLKSVSLADYAGKNIVLNIFPSIDTNVCAASVHEFNKRATSLHDTMVLCVAKDLPFAMKRFCGAEGIDNVVLLSDFRNKGFSKNYGVELIDGAFEGLDARAIVIIDKQGKIKYTELVPQIGDEPNYDAAIDAI
jgi:thiol peroxidase